MMVSIASIYLVFALIGIALFRWIEPARAVAIVPVGEYPPPHAGTFPYWIIGSALPSDMMLVKAWVAPLAALLGGLAFAPARWRSYRFHPLDLAMLGWCMWPLAQGLFVPSTEPPPMLASAYLGGVWGAPWLLGRIYLARDEDRSTFLRVLGWLTVLLLPVAILEGVTGVSVYQWTVGPHPFVVDGADRYLGWRPIAWFEHGNQYGIWVACAAIGALGVAQATFAHRRQESWLVVVILLFAMAVAAQSVGAIALMLLALGFLASGQARALGRRLAVPLACGALVLGAVYVSGAIPAKRIAQSALGHSAIAAMRAAGRGSLPWRISQDQKSVQIIKRDLIGGTGRWGWWASLKTRPRGLGVLVVGQFGLVGLVLAATAIVGPVVRRAIASRRGRETSRSALVMGVVVAMALLDGLLNAFLFLPAIALSGALVMTPGHRHRR